MEVTSKFQDELTKLVKQFNTNQDYELEAKSTQKPTSAQFTNLVKYLKSSGYAELIQEESLDVSLADNHRATIVGLANISEYCRRNKIEISDKSKVSVMTKTNLKGVKSLPVDNTSFKIDLRSEVSVLDDKAIKTLISGPPKGFRLKKRFSYTDPDQIVRFDLTIIRQSFVGNASFVASGVTSATPEYEVEIELIKRSKPAKVESTVTAFIHAVFEAHVVLLNEDYPISKEERMAVLRSYLTLAFGKDQLSKAEELIKTRPKLYFSGPQPVTLEQKNVIPPGLGVVTIQEDYTVTEKADGERMLLYVSSARKVYLINNRLHLFFTGVELDGLKDCLLDGEFITKDVFQKSIKIFAIFDVYWMNGADKRHLPLVSDKSEEPSRLQSMHDFVRKVQPKLNKEMEVVVKEFLYGPSIFEEAAKILGDAAVGKFRYHIDGLIFTPMKFPAGGSYEGDKPDLTGTWKKVFKYKPPSENTIDFLVKFSENNKTVEGGEVEHVLDLFVGAKPVQMQPIPPRMVLEGKVLPGAANGGDYTAVKFVPADVMDETFSQCYTKELVCKNGDVIKDNSIIEFAFDQKKGWQPLRVREDKTQALHEFGLGGTANDYSTAANVWKSIQYPVTKEVITGAARIQAKDIKDDDVYYYRLTTRDKFASKAMLDFHTYWIKGQTLLSKFKLVKATKLFDVSCGKGGDMPKWLDNGFTEVMGIDISRDNIENQFDGAYARTLESRKYDASKNKYVYVTLDSSKKFTREYFNTLPNLDDQSVCENLWGFSKVDSMSKYHGFAKSGFDVVSCQFSIHYFFKDEESLDSLVWNINEHLKDGGYFVGTCLDGKKLKSELKEIPKNDSISGRKGGRIIWDIRKMYTTNVKIKYGDTIKVFMESIGRVFDEYIVDFKVLQEKLAKYNIHLLTKEEQAELNLKKSFDSFEGSYNDYISSGNNSALTEDEKRYSFLNMWFIFKKKTGNKTATPSEVKPKLKYVRKNAA